MQDETLSSQLLDHISDLVTVLLFMLRCFIWLTSSCWSIWFLLVLQKFILLR